MTFQTPSRNTNTATHSMALVIPLNHGAILLNPLNLASSLPAKPVPQGQPCKLWIWMEKILMHGRACVICMLLVVSALFPQVCSCSLVPRSCLLFQFFKNIMHLLLCNLLYPFFSVPRISHSRLAHLSPSYFPCSAPMSHLQGFLPEPTNHSNLPAAHLNRAICFSLALFLRYDIQQLFCR